MKSQPHRTYQELIPVSLLNNTIRVVKNGKKQIYQEKQLRFEDSSRKRKPLFALCLSHLITCPFKRPYRGVGQGYRVYQGLSESQKCEKWQKPLKQKKTAKSQFLVLCQSPLTLFSFRGSIQGAGIGVEGSTKGKNGPKSVKNGKSTEIEKNIKKTEIKKKQKHFFFFFRGSL